jgi:hypothetical protein
MLGDNLDKNMEIITEEYVKNNYNRDLAKKAKQNLYNFQNLMDFLNTKFYKK